MAQMVKPISDGYHSVTPALTMRAPNRRSSFTKRRLGPKSWCGFPSPTERQLDGESPGARLQDTVTQNSQVLDNARNL